MLTPAITSMTAAAIRVISRSGTCFISVLPPTMATPATAHSASQAPRPTAGGSAYFAARLAVVIWVRSPNSAISTITKPVPATRQNPVEAGSFAPSSSSSSSLCSSSIRAPPRNSTPTTASTQRCGSSDSRLPAAMARATCTAKAAAMPAKT